MVNNGHGNKPAVSRQNQTSAHLLQLTKNTGLLALPGLDDSGDGVISLMAEVGIRTGALKSEQLQHPEGLLWHTTSEMNRATQLQVAWRHVCVQHWLVLPHPLQSTCRTVLWNIIKWSVLCCLYLLSYGWGINYHYAKWIHDTNAFQESTCHQHILQMQDKTYLTCWIFTNVPSCLCMLACVASQQLGHVANSDMSWLWHTIYLSM